MAFGQQLCRAALVAVISVLFSAARAGTYQLKFLSGQHNPSGGTLHFSMGDIPYTGDATHYGAVGADFNFLQWEGTISTTWVWVPDQIPDPAPGATGTIPDPLDVPPQAVITMEHCRASYSGFVPFGGFYQSECSNGLGFDAIYQSTEVPGGAIFMGTSDGTVYRRFKGNTAEIVLTCSPAMSVSLTAAPMGGVIEGELWYSSQIIVPKINLLGVTRFHNPEAIEVLTGQQVRATLELAGNPLPAPNQGAPLTVLPNSYQWDIDNAVGPYKDYNPSLSSSQKKVLQTSDKTQTAFYFYTVREDEANVTCSIAFDLPPQSRFEDGLTPFEVKSWKIKSKRPSTPVVPLHIGTASLDLQASPQRIILKDPSGGVHGIEWIDVEIIVPAEFGQVGQGCFCQLITPERYLYGQTANGVIRFRNTYCWKTEGLDVSYPYLFFGQWSLPSLGNFVDSPFQNLSLPIQNIYWNGAEANDSFRTFLMFRPPSKDGLATTWVPVAKVTWNWSGSATLSNGNWSGSPGSAAASLPAKETDHPQWTQVSPSPIAMMQG